jgi:hypothetical protein
MRALKRSVQTWWAGQNRWQRAACVAWLVLLVASCGRGLLYAIPKHRGIYEIYAAAGRHWLAGEALYHNNFDWEGFPYGPLVAAFLAPFAALPNPLGSFCWRLFYTTFFLAAVAWWGRSAFPGRLSSTQRAALLLLLLPLTATTMVNGQIGAVLVGLLLLTTAAAAEGRWNWASVFVMFACVIKVYPVALALLLAVAYPRRLAGRLVIAAAAVLALPYLFRRPEYVTAQYLAWGRLLTNWMQLLRSNGDGNLPLLMNNYNLLLLFRVWLTPLSAKWYQAIQLLSGGCFAVVCWAASRRGWPRQQVLASALGLGTCWMTLFGSAVESFTYILVDPTLCGLLLEAWERGRPLLYRGLLAVSWGLFALAAVSVWTPHSGRFHQLGPHAFATVLLLACLLYTDGKRLLTREAAAELAPTIPAADNAARPAA